MIGAEWRRSRQVGLDVRGRNPREARLSTASMARLTGADRHCRCKIGSSMTCRRRRTVVARSGSRSFAACERRQPLEDSQARQEKVRGAGCAAPQQRS